LLTRSLPKDCRGAENRKTAACARF
jgi:hypothetical protein